MWMRKCVVVFKKRVTPKRVKTKITGPAESQGTGMF